MVDPNRKINRLTDKDIEFLEECEQEFSFRYSDKDIEFLEYYAKPLGDPPIVENWTFGCGGDDGRRNDGGGRIYHNRGGNRGNWHDNRSSGRGKWQYNRAFKVRRGSRGGGDGIGDYGGRGANRYGDANEHRNHYRQRDNLQDSGNIPTRPPINVRRDYNNFVAASKDD